MPYHVPFSQRNRQVLPGPIYIGFDQPVSIQKRRGRFNWAAFVGFLLALVSPLTMFLAAPLALLFSLFGLRRSPRKMATVATVLSLAGTGVLTLLILGTARHHHHAQHVARNYKKVAATRVALEQARASIADWRDQHANHLPDLALGMEMTVAWRDAWERELYYEPVKDGCLVRSAGPDGEFRTRDDIVSRVEGLPDNGRVEEILTGATSSESDSADTGKAE